MSFSTRAPRSGPMRNPLWRALGALMRLCIAAAVLGMLAAGLLLARLSQGPLELRQIGEVIEAAMLAEPGNPRVQIGNTVLSLGSGGSPAGIRFSDVTVLAADGTLLLAAPELTARFDLADLLAGRIQPTRIVLSGPRARILKAADGRIRFGLGTGPGLAMGSEAGAGPDMDAVATIIAGFVGDRTPPRTLARLRQIDILDAAIVYQDAVSGRMWRTVGSDLRLYRLSQGARATMNASLSDDTGNRPAVDVRATRRAGTGITEFQLAFDNLQPDDIAEQATRLSWVRLMDAPLAGTVRFALGPGGVLSDMTGEIRAADALVLPLEGSLGRMDRLRLAFTQMDERRMRLDALEVAGPALNASLSGDLILTGANPMQPDGLAVQLHLHGLDLDMPERFARPLSFERGYLLARLDPRAERVDISSFHVEAGPMVLGATGSLDQTEGGPRLRLRLDGQSVEVAALKALWPRQAAANARAWVVDNLIDGRVSALVAQLDLGGAAERVSLDFRFDGVSSRYLGPMPPIEGASGQGHVTADAFYLALDRGTVTPPGQAPVALDGSSLVFSGFESDRPPADVSLRADGRIGAILALIDLPPLGLMDKLGLDLSGIAGDAAVTADIGFPLLSDLRIEDVVVAARADLSAVAMPLDLGGQSPLALRASALSLEADTRAMRLRGQVMAAGTPLTVDWREDYGTGPGGRRLALSGALTPALLEGIGASVPGFASGSVPLEAVVEQASGGTASLTVAGDLGPAGLSLPALRWEKAAGTPGRLDLRANLARDGALTISSVSADAGDLSLSGRAALAADGSLISADLDRLALVDRADLAARIRPGANGGLSVALTGRHLDLADYLTEPAETETSGDAPLTITAELETLRLTPKLVVAPASAVLGTDAAGTISLDLSGRAAGRAPFEARYDRQSGQPGRIGMSAPDAGALLEALGLFGGGRGGSLRLDAALAPRPGTDLSGEVRIRDMTVQGAGTFGSILAEGGVSEAAEAVQDGGLAFDTIDLPFDYTDGVMRLDDAIARAPLLAVKVAGTIEEKADRIDLAGVISPAYALTGVLDRIPLLGTLLSGGEGEGILAMTFRVTGPLDAPRFSVNPLSLLTPGILRGVFSGQHTRPSQDFIDQLGSGGN